MLTAFRGFRDGDLPGIIRLNRRGVKRFHAFRQFRELDEHPGNGYDRFSTPPRRSDRECAIEMHASLVVLVVGRDVHDSLAEGKEGLAGEVLREEIGEICVRACEWDVELVIFDGFAHVEVTACDVLGAVVELRVVCEIASSLVVGGRWVCQR